MSSAHCSTVREGQRRVWSADVDLADEHPAAVSVDRDHVAGAQHRRSPLVDRAGAQVDPQRGGAADRGPSHAAGHDSGVRGRATGGGDDRRGGDHARQVGGGRLGGHEHDRGAPRSARSTAASLVRAIRPTAAPGAAGSPVTSSGLGAGQPGPGKQQVEDLGRSHSAHRGCLVGDASQGEVDGQAGRGPRRSAGHLLDADQHQPVGVELEPDGDHGAQLSLELGQDAGQQLHARRAAQPKGRWVRPTSSAPRMPRQKDPVGANIPLSKSRETADP